MKRKQLLIVSFLFFAGFQSPLQALGLGELELKSHLHQILDVKIPLISATSNELASLNARITRGEDSLSSGANWSDGLKVKAVGNVDGVPYLKITSVEVLREPAVSFVLELVWSNGRMQREYSLLLNPRGIVAE